jgi:hypothetical protein
LIAGFQGRFPGSTLRLTSGVDAHHSVLRFSWAKVDAEGNVTLEGFDVGELGDDGRLTKITGFFGPFPAATDLSARGSREARNPPQPR